MKRFTSGGIVALCCLLGLGIFNPAAALDTSSQDIFLKYSSELNPVSNSFQIAKSTFLPDYDGNDFSGYDTIGDDFNSTNCEDYPHSPCPIGARCESCPFDVKKYKVVACIDPYLKSEDTCVCPAATPVVYPNDVCTKYCGSTCIAKTCTPTANKTTCTNDFRNCDNGCGQNTRKCCNPCAHKITSKPENSSYTYSSCTDDDGKKQIQNGWKCNEGYHEKNGECEKDCIANNCSGYPLSSCPDNATCSSCSKQTTTCGGGDTLYKKTGCKTGYKDCNGSCIANSECCGGCGANASCSNGTCSCNKGYVGDAKKGCTYVGPCADVKCGANAYCNGGFCYCNKWYVGDAKKGCTYVGPCADVKCGANAYCNGGFCYCNEGYEGDAKKGCEKKKETCEDRGLIDCDGYCTTELNCCLDRCEEQHRGCGYAGPGSIDCDMLAQCRNGCY